MKSLLGTTTNIQGTWTAQSSGVSATFLSVDAITARSAVAAGIAGLIIATRDGGATWQVVREAKALFDLDFIDSSNGWAVGTLGLVLHTQDGGRTYEELPDATDRHLHGVKFIDPANGWVVGEGGTIMRTVDGGRGGCPRPAA